MVVGAQNGSTAHAGSRLDVGRFPMTPPPAELLREIPETAFRQQVLTHAGLMRWRCYFTWTSVHSIGGYPDLSMVRGDRHVYAELKRYGVRSTLAKPNPTVKQRQWLCDLARAGHEVFLWDPSCWPQIEEILGL